MSGKPQSRRRVRACVVITFLLASATVLVASSTAFAATQGKRPSNADVSTRAADGVAQARQNILNAMKPSTFTGPGTPFDMTKNKGKTVWFISPIQSIPLVATIANGVKEAAAAAGLKFVLFDGKGSVVEWNKGILEAVAQKADGIILQGEDPTLIAGSLAKARAAGIPVIDAEVGALNAPLYPGILAHVTIDFRHGGQLLADYVAWKSGGKGHIVGFFDSHFTLHRLIIKGIQDELARVCPKCTFSAQNIDSSSMATQLPAKTVNVLRAKPDTNWLISIFDGESRFIIQGMRTAGAVGKVHLIGHDAVLENLELVRKGEVQEADHGWPLVWKAWAQVDEIGRLMAGLKPVAERVPTRFFTKDNLPKTGKLTEPALFGAIDYRSAYKKLWGVG